jgi:hypothetical protein
MSSILLAIVASMLGITLIAHTHYFVRVSDHVKKTSSTRTFQMKELMAALYIHQGPNFNTLMIISWCLFLAAAAFIFFMTPNDILGTWSYFNTQAASDSFGLAYFGIAVMIVPGIIAVVLIPKAYGYYRIPRRLKQFVMLAPILLLISISGSVYLGTIYPLTNQLYFFLAYVSLLISLAIMLAPIANGYIEEMRT